jgi:predicted 3-demethylubiquinone-9 3-methyltransferase (glyoxalase superfamily)
MLTIYNNQNLQELMKFSTCEIKDREDGLTVAVFKMKGNDFLHIDMNSIMHYKGTLSQIVQSYWIGYLAGKEDKHDE